MLSYTVPNHFISFTLAISFNYDVTGWPDCDGKKNSQTWKLQPSFHGSWVVLSAGGSVL